MGRYGSRTDLMVHGSQNYQYNISGMYQEVSDFRQTLIGAVHMMLSCFLGDPRLGLIQNELDWQVNEIQKQQRGHAEEQGAKEQRSRPYCL
jgi:hypothetical protein